jgi:hypothetical protein
LHECIHTRRLSRSYCTITVPLAARASARPKRGPWAPRSVPVCFVLCLTAVLINTVCTASSLLFTISPPSMTETHQDAPAYSDSFERRLREREFLSNNPLETIPNPTNVQPHGNIPNTPLAVSTISFILGFIFALGFSIFLSRDLNDIWFATYQLGFFVASWSAFHWGEFAVTAGWNRQKVSVDCMYLQYCSPHRRV